LLIEQIHFFINGHKYPPANSLPLQPGDGEVPAGHDRDGTKVREIAVSKSIDLPKDHPPKSLSCGGQDRSVWLRLGYLMADG
jgi:hypothetical protein